ncbi:tyrosine-type recombinase/integrase [Mycobacterium intracellulare]|uniref:tyrosine-type recombinase/integrase n=1 Tax=Mycobacterium intracellulare TaxID=1767 RepID=UPI001F16249F|nr:tyrosine-type recombinase/integrase [Mycobacterium intracellulare]
MCLLEILESWLLTLRSEGKARNTILSYRSSVEAFIRSCEARGVEPAVTALNVKAFLVDLMDSGAETGTTRLRLSHLKIFASWLAEEEGCADLTKIRAIRPPKLAQKPVPALTDAEVRAMLKQASGPDFKSLRDKAILSLMAETGMRANEVVGLDTTDVSLNECALIVRKAKGDRSRRVKFSPATAAAINRYMRARAAAGWGDGALWIGRDGPLTYDGLKYALGARAVRAGVKGFHPHRLRHTAAVRWMKNGGSETGLMAQAGWKSRVMIGRYVNTAAEDLAATEFDRLNLGFGC